MNNFGDLDKFIGQVEQISKNIPFGMYTILKFEWVNGQPKLRQIGTYYLISALFSWGMSTLYHSTVYIDPNLDVAEKAIVDQFIMNLRKRNIYICYNG